MAYKRVNVMGRTHLITLALAALGLCWFAAGCDFATTADYKSYDELQGGAPVAEEVTEPQQSTGVEAAEDDSTQTNPRVAASAGSTSEPQAALLDPMPVMALLPDELLALAQPRKVEVLVKERDFRTEGPDGAVRVTYDDIDLLKVLNMEPVTPDAPELMPDWLKELDGKRIRLRGFMYPPLTETGIQGFGFARDNQICCFGKNPKIYDLFPVILREGETTDYIFGRPFDVVGMFHINAVEYDGKLEYLYEIDDAIVIDK